jgi:hypothetical protein
VSWESSPPEKSAGLELRHAGAPGYPTPEDLREAAFSTKRDDLKRANDEREHEEVEDQETGEGK